MRAWRTGAGVLVCFALCATVAPEGTARAEKHAGPTLVRLSGEALRHALLDPPGRARLLHLWASWCVPCRAELPLLVRELRSRRRAALDVVFLALDDADAEPEAARLLRRAGTISGRKYCAAPLEAGPHLLRIDAKWDGSVPTTYLLDAAGKVLFAQRGLTVLPELMGEIDRALGKE